MRETAQFAYENGTVHPSVLGSPELQAEAAGRVDRVLKLLNLTGCADTIVGNELLRGISGGEKKRVTVAESLVTNARLLAMDEISTGLDAAVTFDIVASIRAWARAMRGTVVIALLQPTPEVYSLFDEVILMREGVSAGTWGSRGRPCVLAWSRPSRPSRQRAGTVSTTNRCSVGGARCSRSRGQASLAYAVTRGRQER